MKFKFLFISLLFVFCILVSAQTEKKYDSFEAEKLGWRLAAQAYTFRYFTLTETLDKLNELGLKYVELYPGQELGGGIKGTTQFNMDEQTRKMLKDLLDRKGIKVVNYGVVSGKNEQEWIQIFEFARALGIETIVTQPMAQYIGQLETLSHKYKIKVAIHNHPKPSIYWHPALMISVFAARSNNIGVCADIGHWARSGLDPFECVRQLEGRIISFHFKDINEFGIRKEHDVPWGTGVCNIAGIMHELKRQGFKGVVSIEYEQNWENSMPEVAECIAYFNRVASWLTPE